MVLVSKRRREPVRFTFNLKPFVVDAVKGERVLARRLLQNGQPSIRVTEFSRKMVEAAIGQPLRDQDYRSSPTPVRREV